MVIQSALPRSPRDTVTKACGAALRHASSSTRRPLSFSGSPNESYLKTDSSRALARRFYTRTYARNAVNDLESRVAISTTKIGAIVAPGRPAHWSDSPVNVARWRSFNSSHSFESDSLMPFDSPSRVNRNLKDNSVAAVAQGPYCLLYHSRPYLNSSIISFDIEYSRLNPFSISPEDYPVGWENGQHPDDYQILSAPLPQQFFVSPHRRRDDLFWFRTSFKLGKDKFLPMSFLIWDLNPTWASSYIYLHARAHHLLKSHGRVDLREHHMRFVNGLFCYPNIISPNEHMQPPNMQPFNLMGEELIRRLELVRKPNGGGWWWRHGMEYW